jgi:hypothetical protein
MVAVRGDDATGYVALDDFDLVEEDTCLTMPEQADPTTLDCNFEGGTCNWVVTSDTEFKWVQRTGKRPFGILIDKSYTI